MAFKDLPAPDKEIVLQCMRTIANGGEIGALEFQTRLGITRDVLARIISEWPDLEDDVPDSDEFLAVNNCMNEICHGIRLTEEDWAKNFTVSLESVSKTYARWLSLNGQRGGLR